MIALSPRKAKAFAIAIFLGVAMACCGQVTHVGGRYLFRVELKKGDHFLFLIPTKVIQPGGRPFTIELSASIKVLKTENGIATVQGSLHSPIQGQQPGGTEQVTNRGEVLESGFASGLFVVFPEKPLKVGESFRSSIPVKNFSNQGQGADTTQSEATYTFKGIVQINGESAARFVFKTKDGSCKGAALISVKDGLPLRYFASELLPIHTGGKPIRADISMIRKK